MDKKIVKTPKSLLKEEADKSKAILKPTTFTQIFDKNGNPTAWRADSVFDNYYGRTFTGFSISTTKKEAEHSACKQIQSQLESLAIHNSLAPATQPAMIPQDSMSNGINMPDQIDRITTGLSRMYNSNPIPKPLDSETMLRNARVRNNIGELDNKCTSMLWNKPVYEHKQYGEGQDAIHEVTCFLNRMTTSGVSRQKQNSKHLAAYKMLAELGWMTNPVVGSNPSSAPPNVLSQSNIPTPSPSGSSGYSNLNSTPKLNPSNEPKESPQRVNKIYYYLGQMLGPSVYRGYFETPNVKAAVKILPNRGDLTHYTENIREIKILQEIRHDNLIRYFVSDCHNSSIYIAMELAEYGTLDDYMEKNKRHDYSLSKKFLKDAVAGLEYLHLDDKPKKRIIVHRDIKPSNILICGVSGKPDRVAKIADFGISKPITSKTFGEPTLAKCTLNWASPETLKALKNVYNVTPSTDIFSMAMVIFYVMTGVHPFYDANEEDPYNTTRNIVKEDPDWKMLYSSRVKESISLRNLLEQMLKKEPHQRIPITEVKKHPFFWNSEQNLSFIIAIANDLKSSKELNPMQLNQTFQNQFKDWDKRLCPSVRNFLQNKLNSKNYSGNLVVKLIEFIRDKNQHYEELVKFPQLLSDGVFGDNGKDYMNYFTNTFPELTVYLYDYFMDERERGMKLKEFYAKL